MKKFNNIFKILFIIGIALIFFRFVLPPQSCHLETNAYKRSILPGESIRGYTLNQVEALRECKVENDYSKATKHSLIISVIFLLPFLLSTYAIKPKREKTTNRTSRLQRLENYLFNREKSDFLDFKKNPVRWIIIKSLIIPAVAFGVNIGSNSIEMGAYFIGGTIFIMATHISSALKAQNALRRHKIFAFVSIVMAIILGIFILII